MFVVLTWYLKDDRQLLLEGQGNMASHLSVFVPGSVVACSIVQSIIYQHHILILFHSSLQLFYRYFMSMPLS